jgi:hypothetical protein
MAVRCAQHPELKEEWEKYLEQTENHERSCAASAKRSGSTPRSRRRAPDRPPQGRGLVGAMEMALKAGDLAAAQLVAAECVVDAETKDHQNWELIGQVADTLKGDEGDGTQGAYEEVEDEEDEHLYHTQGWCRELWIQSLGMPAQLPPPEEKKDVKTAIGAARAKQARKPTSRKKEVQNG